MPRASLANTLFSMSVHTFETMGTMVSIRLIDAGTGDALASAAEQAIEQISARLAELNERFSLYRDDSEMSKIARGEVALTNSSEEMREEYTRALHWRDVTSGAFTPHRPDGVLDLSGTIKAVGISESARILSEAGFSNFSVNIGGDIATLGVQELATDSAVGSTPWTTGIVDPLDREKLLTVIELTAEMSAMATSGNAERGEHIWKRPETTGDFIQVSVVAPDIIAADVCATAIMSGGQETLNLLTSTLPIAVLAVNSAGELSANPRFTQLVAGR